MTEFEIRLREYAARQGYDFDTVIAAAVANDIASWGDQHPTDADVAAVVDWIVGVPPAERTPHE